MGRKKKKSKRSSKPFEMVCDQPEMIDLDAILRNKGAKDKSKLSKKMKKKLAREQLSDEKEKNRNIKTWHKISIHSSNIDKKFLFDSLGNYVDIAFAPLGFHRETDNVCFFLEKNSEAAKSIAALDRRIQGSDGHVMKIKMSPVAVPDLIPNANQLLILKEAIARRYDQNNCLLDLSSFHLDSFLLERDILVPLSSNVIMKCVLRILKEHVGKLQALNLSNNNLGCENVKLLSDLAPSFSLSALNLTNNNLVNLSFLQHIKVFPLVELNLDLNPALKHAKNTQSYVNTILRYFPTVKLLDNQEINGGGDASSKILGASFEPANPVAIDESSLKCFLEQYFLQFDTPERINLISAYLPEAKVAIQSFTPEIPSATLQGLECLKEFLSRFPETKHVHSSFNLKMIKIEPREGCVEVSGTCQFNGIEKPLNFIRRMVIMPYKTGLCCSCDQIEVIS